MKIKRNLGKILISAFLVVFTLVAIYLDMRKHSIYLASIDLRECKVYVEQGYKSNFSSPESFYNENCENILSNSNYVLDTYSTMMNIINGEKIYLIFPFGIPVLIAIAISYDICKRYRSKEPKNFLIRENYSSYLLNIFKSSYKLALIYPLCALIMAIIAYLISGHFNYIADSNYANFSTQILGGMPYTGFAYFINLFLVAVFYINMVLIICRFNKNTMAAILESILIIYFTEFYSEIIIGTYIEELLHGNCYVVYFVNMINLTGIENIYGCTLTLIIYILITFFVLWLSYKNKEKFIQACER